MHSQSVTDPIADTLRQFDALLRTAISQGLWGTVGIEVEIAGGQIAESRVKHESRNRPKK